MSSGSTAAARGNNYSAHSQEVFRTAVAASLPADVRKCLRSPTRADRGGAARARAETAGVKQEGADSQTGAAASGTESESAPAIETAQTASTRSAMRRAFEAGEGTTRRPQSWWNTRAEKVCAIRRTPRKSAERCLRRRVGNGNGFVGPL